MLDYNTPKLTGNPLPTCSLRHYGRERESGSRNRAFQSRQSPYTWPIAIGDQRGSVRFHETKTGTELVLNTPVAFDQTISA